MEIETPKSFEELKKYSSDLFPQAKNLICKYKDEDGDWVRFSDEKEYNYLLEYHKKLESDIIILRIDDPEYIKMQEKIQELYCSGQNQMEKMRMAALRRELMTKRMKMNQMLNVRKTMTQMNSPYFFSSFCKSRTSKCPKCKGKKVCECGKFGEFCSEYYKQDNPFINAGSDPCPIKKAFSLLFKPKCCGGKKLEKKEEIKTTGCKAKIETENNIKKTQCTSKQEQVEDVHDKLLEEMTLQVKELTEKLAKERECIIKVVLRNFFDGCDEKVKKGIAYIYELKGLEFNEEQFDKCNKKCKEAEKKLFENMIK